MSQRWSGKRQILSNRRPASCRPRDGQPLTSSITAPRRRDGAARIGLHELPFAVTAAGARSAEQGAKAFCVRSSTKATTDFFTGSSRETTLGSVESVNENICCRVCHQVAPSLAAPPLLRLAGCCDFHFDMAIQFANGETGLVMRGWAIQHAAIVEGKLGSMPRTHHRAVLERAFR